ALRDERSEHPEGQYGWSQACARAWLGAAARGGELAWTLTLPSAAEVPFPSGCSVVRPSGTDDRCVHRHGKCRRTADHGPHS
ncbi:MAG TPA: hypothetical protein VK988_03490, partial [Acidimicrobiales bacterium]|nr:hypothetical protein [Acidimicrobiales bacterium]